MTPTTRDEIPPGTLDLLILKTLAPDGEMHGFEIANAIQQRSEDILRVDEGSLYPALQRMLLKGWLQGEWGKTAENRRARYYRLTRAGRKQLEQEMARYRRVTAAIHRIIQPA
ncbi:MAG TPA: PadR family transcriptional regulator [Bryobacteraceae bacterium]|jgi:transcriptional regulator|nr:PadR family transcriptional regulator [Bryobacteraceae bacterium]